MAPKTKEASSPSQSQKGGPKGQESRQWWKATPTPHKELAQEKLAWTLCLRQVPLTTESAMKKMEGKHGGYTCIPVDNKDNRHQSKPAV